ncbi:MAG: hypothetical protein FVQ83_16900 [Chloroflexi bacterium]|nr:hypothetical protein [Chloroflexota bacterium]
MKRNQIITIVTTLFMLFLCFCVVATSSFYFLVPNYKPEWAFWEKSSSSSSRSDRDRDRDEEASSDGDRDEEPASDFTGTLDGLAVTFTEDDDFGFVAVHESGEQLIAMTESFSNGVERVIGAIWISPEGETVVVYNGDDGLPERVFVGDNILVFSNYTNNTVDVSVIYPNGEIEVTREIPVDADALDELQAYNAGGRETASLDSAYIPNLAFDFRKALRITAFTLSVAGCAGAFILGGPLGLVCASAVVSGASLMLYENEALENTSVAFGAFSCGAAFVDVGSLVECVPFVLETSAALLGAAERAEASQSTSLNLAHSSLTFGGGDVQITLTWDNSADLDLWVTEPSGEKIYFSNDISDTGGELDVDDTNGYGPENIFWDDGQAPSGDYLVQVDHFSGASGANYQVLVQINGETYNFSGTISSGIDTVFTFEQ